MKKVLLLALVALSIFLGYSFGFGRKDNQIADIAKPKTAILRIGLVADSHNENDLLRDALRQAQGKGINFVIGLGDYTNLGTVRELEEARAKFDESKLEYFLTAGDRDGWESRNREEADNFKEIFGNATRVFDRERVRFVILDNSDIYSGISQEDWEILRKVTEVTKEPKEPNNLKLIFVFAHKTPFHPESQHIMGEDSFAVAKQAQELVKLLEEQKVDGFFSGDLHFFAKYQSPGQSVKITTVGAVALERNFQGPRFSVLTVYEDYSWEIQDIAIN